MAAFNFNNSPTLTTAQFASLKELVISVTAGHGLNPLNFSNQTNVLGFRLQGVKGSTMCWISYHGLTLGGMGFISQDIVKALHSTCRMVGG